MLEPKKTIDSPDEKSVGSREPKEPIEGEAIGGSSGETHGPAGAGGDVGNQDNPTSVPAG